jgi:uncharacterized protein YjdB
MKTRLILLALMIPMTAVGVGCSDVNTIPTAPTFVQQSTHQTALAPVLSVQISPPVESMRIGETLSFSARAALGDGVPPSAGGLPRWSSTNPGVITIDFSGNATAIEKGSATIELTFMGHKTMRTIHVP